MKVFYHSDNDGKCAGYLVRRLNKLTDNFNDEYIKINYGMEFPFDSIGKDEIVYIVDYSILPEEMDRLLEITKNVIWVDHHKSAIERYENYDKKIDGLRYDGIAGCMLTYCYLQYLVNGVEFSTDLTKTAQEFVKLIADYDVWAFRYGDTTRKFQKGFEFYPHEPLNKIWDELEEESCITSTLMLNEILDRGDTIIEYRKNMMKDYCENEGFEAMLGNYKCFAINMARVGSDDFVIDNADDYDILVGFSFDGEKWTYSLRSTKVDCSECAMKFGGGGHKGAAGFRSTDFVMKKIV